MPPGRLRSSGSQESRGAPLAGFVSTLIIFTLGTAAAMAILFGAFLRDLVRNTQQEDVAGTLTGHAASRAGRSAAPHPMAPCPLGIGRRAAATGVTRLCPRSLAVGCVIAGQSAVWRIGREQPARADAELLPVGGDARG